MNRTRRRVTLIVTAVVVVIAAVLAVGALDESRRQLDLTTDSTLTLTAATREVTGALTGDVEMTALIDRGSTGRAEAVALLDRYSRLDRRITVRVVDPADVPGELRRLGVNPLLEELVVRRGDRVERSTTITEQDITGALARLERNRTPTLCFSTGHGEVSIDDTSSSGIAALGGLLARNGAIVQPLDLLTGTTVPPECRVVVIASPTSALGSAADALAQYLAAGGRALVLADPSSTVDLAPILQPHGLGLDRGIVVEGDEDARLPNDPVSVVARSFPTGNPIARGLAPLVLAASQAIQVEDGPSTTTLVRSTRLAYLERNPSSFSFDPGTDRAGPLPLAAAADRSTIVNGNVTRTRLVVVGDSDLATNDIIDQGDNGRFLLQAIDWLSADDDLVTVSANLARVRPLALTPGRVRYARLMLAGVVPAAFLLAGLAMTLIRRRR